MRWTVLVLVGAMGIGAGVAWAAMRAEPRDRDPSVAPVERTLLAIERVESAQWDAGGQPGDSWPGDIISWGDVEIQPTREGAIVEWLVGVGKRVQRGQPIARLSAPPAMPELTGMLAEQSKMRTEARADAQAMATYAQKNAAQLRTFRASLEQKKSAVGTILGEGASSQQAQVTEAARTAWERARDQANAQQVRIRAIVEQSLIQEFPHIAEQPKDPFAFYRAKGGWTLTFMPGIGTKNDQTQRAFRDAGWKLLEELDRSPTITEATASAYFVAAKNLASASMTSDELTLAALAELQAMIAEDRQMFLEAMQEFREAQTEAAMKETDWLMRKTEYGMGRVDQNAELAEQMKEIDEQIAMLERDVAMANGKARAAEVAYATVARSVTEGLHVLAPRHGVITAISKKTGEFVGPGMPIATLNTGNASERLIRFRVPGTESPPVVGAAISVVRPGFPTDLRTVRVTGVGTALDPQGFYIADAVPEGRFDWPVGASVRVLAPARMSPTILVPLAAVWWDETRAANVWVVEHDTLYARRIIAGRVQYDRIEVIEGLREGETYVTKLVPGLKEGISARGTATPTTPSNGRSGKSAHEGMNME